MKKFTISLGLDSAFIYSPEAWVGMAKKMSLDEILAAARAQKAGGAAPPAPPAAEEPAAPPAESPAADAPKPAAKPAAKPGAMSVADIIAAAKAAKGGAAPAPAKPTAEKPAPAKAVPAPKATEEKKPAAAVASGPKDTASILAAARTGAKPGPLSKAEAAAKTEDKPAAAAGKKKIDVPPMPAKPAFAQSRPAAAAPVASGSRRGFMSMAAAFLFGTPLAIGFTSLAVTHLAWGLGLARFMFPNILIEPPTRFKVGFPDGYGPGQVETKYIPQFGVWVVKYEVDGQPMIFALKSVCTHLGCTPNWLESEQKFKCPCHGSGFYKDGVNFEGPAPRPLERYAISLADDGQLEVDKSRTFQQELGQWKDSASFVPV